MAATIMENLLQGKDILVGSRGMVVLFPEPYNPKAVAVAASYGLIMPSNNAVQIDSRDFGSDTLVLVMNQGMKQKLYDTFDRAINVYTLCEFVREPEEEVADPYGRGADEYKACFEKLQFLVSKAAQRIIDNMNEEEEN
ncbi:MAG: protein tyrosine phosphatase [Lachnospira sp.]|nr:protein tyrosine phosphatase [Lachnospira sp.]